MLRPDQFFPYQPVDMTAHNSNIIHSAMYHHSQPSSSATARLNDSIPTPGNVSNKSSTYTSSNIEATQCHSSTDPSASHSSRQLFPPIDTHLDPASNANLQSYPLYPQNYNLPSSHRQMQIAQAMTQSSMLQSNYYAWMSGGNSSMMRPTNDTTSQQNVNYQQNMYLQQPQSQQNSNINSTNVNLSYVNGSNNSFLDMWRRKRKQFPGVLQSCAKSLDIRRKRNSS